jgi:hypothetical protein
MQSRTYLYCVNCGRRLELRGEYERKAKTTADS